MIMNVSEFVNGRSETSADDAALAEKVVSAFKSAFPNGWIRTRRVRRAPGGSGGRGVYVAFGLVDDVNAMGGYRENDPMFHSVLVDFTNRGYESTLGNGGKVYLKPAPGSFYAMDSVKIGFRKFSGDEKKIVDGFVKYFAKARAVVAENADNVYGRERYHDMFFA